MTHPVVTNFAAVDVVNYEQHKSYDHRFSGVPILPKSLWHLDKSAYQLKILDYSYLISGIYKFLPHTFAGKHSLKWIFISKECLKWVFISKKCFKWILVSKKLLKYLIRVAKFEILSSTVSSSWCVAIVIAAMFLCCEKP